MNSLSHSCLVSLLGACLLASSLNAQEPVRILSGTVSNAQGEPLSASIVQLTDSTQAAGYRGLAETDSVGRFHVEVSGPVNRLLVSRLGYQMQAVPVAAGQDSYAIVLARNAEMQLDEVSVTANRKVVQVMPSGIAYDMQHSPAKSGEMLDALRFVPLLSVSPTGEISVVGKSGGVAYYVDGRKLRLEGEALTAYLRTLRAEDVKSVEVLTAPDGRFQEPVDCGVVNIVTRQGELEGLKGAVNARLSQSHYTDADGSVMLTYGRGRFSASVFAFGSLNQVWTEEDVAYRYVQTRDLRLVGATYVQRVRDFDVQALATYRPTEHSSLNGQVSVSYAPNGQSVDGSTRYYGPDGVSEEARIRERNEIDEPEKRVAAHVEYLNTFGRPGTQLKLAADYYHGYATQEQDMRMDSILADGTTRPHAYYLDDAPQQSDVWSGEVRYTFPAGSKATLTVGGNGYKSVVDNNDRHRVWQDGGYVLDPLVSHDLQMDEWSVSALAQLSGTWNEHWTTMLSYQQKYRDYRSLMGSTGERYKRKFWEPQASASIVYKANPDHVLSYSGTYTMTAPDFNSLNPFRLYSSSTRYVEGNPYLLSAKLLYQSLRYQFLQKFMVGVNHFYVADGVESISSVDGDGLVVSRPENSLDNQGFHVYLSATGLSYAKERGSLTLTAALYGDYYRRDLRGEKQKQSDLGYAAGANHLFRLWPARQLQMVNTLTFYSKKNTGMWRIPAKLTFYTEVQKQAGDWNFSLSGFVTAHVMDKRMSLTSTSYYVEPTLHSENNTRNDGYYGCTLKVSYTFGNQKVRDVRRSESTNSEVRSRLK